MVSIIVTLECITNMHVGNGEINYNIIDNEVEKDPVTGYPTINSSGVKGALREYFSALKLGNEKELITKIFGSDSSDNSSAGTLKFLAADLIARPARGSGGNQAYYLLSSPTSIKRYQELHQVFLGGELEIKDEKLPDSDKAAAEGIKLSKFISLFDKKLYIVEENNFKNIDLPVMARNKLDNGVSKNLWYEEVVPHKSIFCFPVICNDGDKSVLEDFRKKVHNQVIQFGGSASIGYGLCKVTCVGGVKANE